jgi:hypothetical protein
MRHLVYSRVLCFGAQGMFRFFPDLLFHHHAVPDPGEMLFGVPDPARLFVPTGTPFDSTHIMKRPV